MKKIMFALGLMFTALTLTNCSQEIDDTINPNNSQKGFAVFADVPETRTTIDGFTTEWKAGDALTLFYNNTYAGSFTNSEENLNKFEGTEPTLDAETEYTWYAIYPANTYNSSKNPEKTAYDNVGYASYTQDGYNSTAHVCGDNAPLWGKTTTATGENSVQFGMHHLCSMLAINVTNAHDANITINKVSFASDTHDFVGTYHLNLTGEKVDYISSGASYVYKAATVTVKDATEVEPNGQAIVYLPIKPFTTTEGEKLTLTVYTDKGIKESTITCGATATEFVAGKIKTVTFAVDGFGENGAELPLVEDFSWTTADSNESTEIKTAPEGWSYTKVYSAANVGEVKYGTGSDAGSLTLPALNLSNGEYTVIINAKAYGTDSAKLNILTDGEQIGQITLTENYAPYHVYGNAATAGSIITIAATYASKCRGYISEIRVVEGKVMPSAEIHATTNNATDYTDTTDGTTATLNGSYYAANLTGDETIAVGFEYKLTSATDYTSVTATYNSGVFSYNLTGLTNEAEYTFRAWASLDGGTTKVYGEDNTFTPTKVAEGYTAKTYTLTIDKSAFNSTSYAANNNEKTSTATATDGSTIEVKWTSYQVMNQNSTMQWQKSKGSIYNTDSWGTIESITVNSSAGSFTKYIGSAKQPTSNGTGGYFQIKVGGATGKVNSITITFTK